MVKVPVLSEHITVVAPNVSAEASFLIIAFRLASSLAPKANDIVTTAGRPSGTADTASAIAVKKLSTIEPDHAGSISSKTKIIAHTATIIIASFFAKLSSLSLRGVSTPFTV